VPKTSHKKTSAKKINKNDENDSFEKPKSAKTERRKNSKWYLEYKLFMIIIFIR